MTLISTIADSIAAVTWGTTGHNRDMIGHGATLNKYGVSTFETEIDYYNDLDTWGGYANAAMLHAIALEHGFASATLTTLAKATLLGYDMLGTKHLPYNTDLGGASFDCYRYCLGPVISMSQQLEYLESKWNPRLAWQELKVIIDIAHAAASNAQTVDPTDNSYSAGNNRFYDENMQWVALFLDFYELDRANNTAALTYATETLWPYINTNHWNGTDGHYQYTPISNIVECEGAFFHLVAARLRALNGYSLTNWDHILTDIGNRMIGTTGWNGAQWFEGANTYYAVVHANPGNIQRRLENTLGSWTCLHAFFSLLSTAQQGFVQVMIDGDVPANRAWCHLIADSGLYDAVTKKFRDFSDGALDDPATTRGIVLLFLLGIMPGPPSGGSSGAGYLAVPLIESKYEWDYLHGYFMFDYTNQKIRIPVVAGTITFLYGSSDTSYTFPSNGVYEITFSDDWNFINAVTKISELDYDMLYADPLTEGVLSADRVSTLGLLRKSGAIETVTWQHLVLGQLTNDVTGWYHKSYESNSAEMVIVPHGASFSFLDTGFYSSKDATAFAVEDIEDGDIITTEDAVNYLVIGTTRYKIASKHLDFVRCDLEKMMT